MQMLRRRGRGPLRVIAGQYRSRPLRSPRGTDVRPTADRLRESLFNVLTAGKPKALVGSVWLDLYAGTGAVGIEAISRGASQVYFVESSMAAVKIIRGNLASLGIASGFEVVCSDVVKALRRFEAQSLGVDFIFLDPPYKSEQAYGETLQFLGKSELLKESSLVIVEHQKKFDPGGTTGSLRRTCKLAQGEGGLSFYRRT